MNCWNMIIYIYIYICFVFCFCLLGGEGGDSFLVHGCIERKTIVLHLCRSDRELLGPNNQYLPKIVAVFAEV